MKTIILLISVVISIIVTPAFSQSNFKEGYIIKANGDTLRGFVDHRGDYKNARIVYFKAALADKAVKYEPDSLRFYHVSSKSYFVRNIQLDLVNKIVKRKVFLEALVIGRANLYYFKDISQEDQFYIEKDSVFERISSEERTITNEEGKTFISRNNKYLRILNNLFNDCPSWSANTDFEFEENALRRVVRRYNNCFADKNPIKVDNIDTVGQKVKVGYIFQIGLSHSTVIQTGGPVPGSEIENPTGKYGLTAGVAFNFIIPRINNNLSFELGINYNQKGVKSTGKYLHSEYDNSYVYTTTEYKMSFVDLSAMIKYTYPKGKIRPFIGLGGFNGYLFNKGNAFKIASHTKNYPTIVISDSHMREASISVEVGYCGEIGVMIPVSKDNKIIISLRYERSLIPTNGNVNYHNVYIDDFGNVRYYPYKFSIEALQFKVGYKFR